MEAFTAGQEDPHSVQFRPLRLPVFTEDQAFDLLTGTARGEVLGDLHGVAGRF